MNRYLSLSVIIIVLLFIVAIVVFPKIQPFEIGAEKNGVFGTVYIGPLCPVIQKGKDCPDRPYEARLVVSDKNNRRIKEFSSNSEGEFKVNLPPGEYIINSAAAANVLPYCQGQYFRVSRGEYTEVNVSCDTGIR